MIKFAFEAKSKPTVIAITLIIFKNKLATRTKINILWIA